MLTVIRSMRELSFGKLMEVYREENHQLAAQQYSHLPAGQGLNQAEQDFYQYLRNHFFPIPGAVYCVWKEGDSYVSALRLEPYQDGLLLTALETAPERRNRGYAGALLRAVQTQLAGQGSVKLYSHIRDDNLPSVAVHKKFGFQKISNHARYLDGSVSSRAGTYLYES